MCDKEKAIKKAKELEEKKVFSKKELEDENKEFMRQKKKLDRLINS